MRLTAMIILTVLPMAGCATKRYPMAVTLSPEEVALMDCKDLHLEEARIAQTQAQIDDIAGTDWRSIAGFLGDYGIGNAMAKSEAEKALRERAQAVRLTTVQKNCGGVSATTVASASARDAAHDPLQPAYYDAKIIGLIMPGGEIRTFAERKQIVVPKGVDGRDYVQPVTDEGRVIGVVTTEGLVYPLEGESVLGAAAE